MVESKSAPFGFANFKIPSFSYKEPELLQVQIKLDFEPSGIYFQKEGVFELKIKFIGYEEGNRENQIVNLTCIATFTFEPGLPYNEIPNFFYKNAIAITFPYLRSFVSTLTLQANTGLILLGLMNLSNLEQPLIENTISE